MEEQKRSFSGSRKVLFLDLGIGYTEGSVLNILLSFPLRISAFLCVYIVFQQKVNKRGYVPQLEFPDPRLSCPFSSILDAIHSEDGFQRMAGVTSANARREKIENLCLRFSNWETEACRQKVTCPLSHSELR